MGMIACYMEADEALIEKMKKMDAEELAEILEDLEDEGELDIYDMDKMWDGLHCLLTGNSAGSPIDGNHLSECINGEVTFSDDDFIAYTSTKRLKEILKEMEKVDVKKLRSSFSCKEFEKKEIYPSIWDKENEDELFEELISSFEDLKEFYKKTCDKNYGVIVSIL